MNDSKGNPDAAALEVEEKAAITETETDAAQKNDVPPAESETVAKTAAKKPENANDSQSQSKIDERLKRINSIEWRVCGETVPGASHLRAGIPNQDAILQIRASSVGLPIILAVSDGHGSNKCFRSDRGSRFAVHLAVGLLSKTLNEIYTDAKCLDDLEKFKEEMRKRLPSELVRRWRSTVEIDLEREPLQEAEFERLVTKDGPRARKLVEANPYLAYGATLLAVALTETFAIYMQLGDGEILNVSETGAVTLPLPDDERLLANETTSLCLEHAAEDFRFTVRPLEDDLPAMILLTTDGYANSFSSTAGFHQVGGDILEMMRADGFDSVNRNIKGWLEQATAEGSGDDCTLALIVRADALEANRSPKESADDVSVPIKQVTT
jgi:serine/threonine protein phosphatase PrpC